MCLVFESVYQIVVLVCVFCKVSGDIEVGDVVIGDCLENCFGCCEIVDMQLSVCFVDFEFDLIC